jgi:hypothetical protein
MIKKIALLLAGTAAVAAASVAGTGTANAQGSWTANSDSPYATIVVDGYGHPMVGYGNNAYGGSISVQFADNPYATWVSCSSSTYGGTIAYRGEINPRNGYPYTGVTCYL